jgi:hypothetical protein
MCAKRRGGRPGVLAEIRRLVVQMAEDNPMGLHANRRRAEECGPSGQSVGNRTRTEGAGDTACTRAPRNYSAIPHEEYLTLRAAGLMSDRFPADTIPITVTAGIGPLQLLAHGGHGCMSPATSLSVSPLSTRTCRASRARTGASSLAKGLAEAMHGTIAAESVVDRGSTFTLGLPLSAAAAVGTDGALLPPVPAGNCTGVVVTLRTTTRTYI